MAQMFSRRTQNVNDVVFEIPMMPQDPNLQAQARQIQGLSEIFESSNLAQEGRVNKLAKRDPNIKGQTASLSHAA